MSVDYDDRIERIKGRIKAIYKAAMSQKQCETIYRRSAAVSFNYDEQDFEPKVMNVPLWFIEKKGISK